MAKYAIWNKEDRIITPIGEVLTAEQWKERYPVARLDDITILCAAGEINGAIFATLGSTVERYKEKGADFSSATTPEEKLAIINSFDEQKQKELNDVVSNEELTATSLASIAASLEYQNMLTLDDVEV